MAKDVKKDKGTEDETFALKEAMSFVVGKRLPIPKNWSGADVEDLEFPDDLSKLSFSHLGELLGVWSTVMAYAQYEAARADIDKTARGNRYEFEKKRLYLSLTGTAGMTEEHRKSQVYVATAVLQAEYETAKAKYILTNALLNVYSKYYQALSRELSRRGLDGMEAPPKQSSFEDDGDDVDFSSGRAMLTKEWLNEEGDISEVDE